MFSPCIPFFVFVFVFSHAVCCCCCSFGLKKVFVNSKVNTCFTVCTCVWCVSVSARAWIKQYLKCISSIFFFHTETHVTWYLLSCCENCCYCLYVKQILCVTINWHFLKGRKREKMRLRHDYTCIRVWVKEHFFNQSSFVTCMAARYVYCSVVDIAHHILCVLLLSRSHCVHFCEHVNKTLYCFHCLILFRLCTISVSIWQEIKLPIPSIT